MAVFISQAYKAFFEVDSNEKVKILYRMMGKSQMKRSR